MKKYEDIDLLRRAMMEDVGFNTWTISTPHLMRFAELVRADERERIATYLEDEWYEYYGVDRMAASVREGRKTKDET